MMKNAKKVLSILLATSLLLSPVKGEANPLLFLAFSAALEAVNIIVDSGKKSSDLSEIEKREAKLNAYVDRLWGAYIYDYEAMESVPTYFQQSARVVNRACKDLNVSCGVVDPQRMFLSLTPESSMRFASIGVPGERHSVVYELSADALLHPNPVLGFANELALAILESPGNQRIELARKYNLVGAALLSQFQIKILEAYRSELGQPDDTQAIKVDIGQRGAPIWGNDIAARFAFYQERLMVRRYLGIMTSQSNLALNAPLEARVLMSQDLRVETERPIAYVVPCSASESGPNLIIGKFVRLPPCEKLDMVNTPERLGDTRLKSLMSIKRAPELAFMAAGVVATGIFFFYMSKIKAVANSAQMFKFPGANSLTGGLLEGTPLALRYSSRYLNRVAAVRMTFLGVSATVGMSVGYAGVDGVRASRLAKLKEADSEDVTKYGRLLHYIEDKLLELQELEKASAEDPDKKQEFQVKLQALRQEVVVRLREYGIQDISFLRIQDGARLNLLK